ncbi:hypothetical protein FSP39_003561, partial [Pinctada imbricata]
NVALNKTAYQSSTYWFGVANKGIDGNTDTNFMHGSCTQTRQTDSPYWYVDLGFKSHIQFVEITNRGDGPYSRLRDLEVTIASERKEFNMLCNTFKGPGTASQIVVLNCPQGTWGRYVKIQIVEGIDNTLTFCEVKVFGV